MMEGISACEVRLVADCTVVVVDCTVVVVEPPTAVREGVPLENQNEPFAVFLQTKGVFLTRRF
jgi:hypothetical protein